MLVNTITGVKSINPLLIEAAPDLGASRVQIFVKVILPGVAEHRHGTASRGRLLQWVERRACPWARG